jgi:Flp pilus assembly pilin Flp
MQKLYRLLKQDEAQTMAEYATVLTVVTIACLGAFALLAAAATGALTRVAGFLG